MSFLRNKKVLIMGAGVIVGIILLVGIVNLYQIMQKNNQEITMLKQRGISADAHRVLIEQGKFSTKKLTIKPNDSVVFFTRDEGMNYYLLMNGFEIARIKGKTSPSGPDELFNYVLPAPGTVLFSVFPDTASQEQEDTLEVIIK